VLIGPAGVGKTTVGRLLAQELDWPFVDLDETAELFVGVGPSEFPQWFRSASKQDRLLCMAAVWEAAQTQCAVVSAGARTPCDLHRALSLIRLGACIWLDAEVDIIAARLTALEQGLAEGTLRFTAPFHATGSPMTVILRRYRRSKHWYHALADARIDTSRANPREVVDKVIVEIRPVRDKYSR